MCVHFVFFISTLLLGVYFVLMKVDENDQVKNEKDCPFCRSDLE